jgi:hypothetical protein
MRYNLAEPSVVSDNSLLKTICENSVSFPLIGLAYSTDTRNGSGCAFQETTVVIVVFTSVTSNFFRRYA